MESEITPHVIEAQRLKSGVIITFDDGKCAVYSNSLLYASLHQAEELHPDSAECNCEDLE